eukprot:TRINITY_DN67283_c0_g1_i1.p1 TRINITY_DN67283_c0_g1~~TRINITY_DN67283_c0_g1_i1.p1  ORF type:complete len:105 (+),score=1.83 TRINITY_DN67283_c0_g1_i1:2348-2662(+)
MTSIEGSANVSNSLIEMNVQTSSGATHLVSNLMGSCPIEVPMEMNLSDITAGNDVQCAFINETSLRWETTGSWVKDGSKLNITLSAVTTTKWTCCYNHMTSYGG